MILLASIIYLEILEILFIYTFDNYTSKKKLILYKLI